MIHRRPKEVWQRREESKEFDEGYRSAEETCNRTIESVQRRERIKFERQKTIELDAARQTALRACNV